MTETIWDIMNQLTLPYEERVRLCRRIEQWHDGEVGALKEAAISYESAWGNRKTENEHMVTEIETLRQEVERLREERDAAVREVGEANRALGMLQAEFAGLRELAMAVKNYDQQWDGSTEKEQWQEIIMDRLKRLLGS